MEQEIFSKKVWIGVLFVVAILSSSIAPLLVKEYSVSKWSSRFRWILLLLAFLFYGVLVLIYATLLKVPSQPKLGMDQIYPIVKVSSVVLVVIFAVIFFGEPLTLKTTLGISLAVLALVLLA